MKLRETKIAVFQQICHEKKNFAAILSSPDDAADHLRLLKIPLKFTLLDTELCVIGSQLQPRNANERYPPLNRQMLFDSPVRRPSGVNILVISGGIPRFKPKVDLEKLFAYSGSNWTSIYPS